MNFMTDLLCEMRHYSIVFHEVAVNPKLNHGPAHRARPLTSAAVFAFFIDALLCRGPGLQVRREFGS
jgi:hypothetical protein